MSHLFWKIYWKITGWKFVGNYPFQIKKMVLIIAPHTSWKDIIIGLASRSVLKAYNIKVLAKKELFDGPFAWFFRWIGGIPVDRFSSGGAIDQVVEMFNKNEDFVVGLSPEGTRKKVDRLRTGFYYIAKKANVPIVMLGFDFANRRVIISEPFTTSDNEAADFRKIIAFFAPIKGKHPEKGLEDLKDLYR